MTDKSKIVALLLILPLFTVALTTNNFQEVDAVKSKGNDAPSRVGTKSYGSKTDHIICGDKLCSEISGGKQAVEKPAVKTQVKTEKPSTKTPQPAGAEETEQALRLSRASVPATIPLHKGWYNGEPVYYIITDSSEQSHADIITKNQGWKVELAPPLANTPKTALSKTYIFTNGIKGDGIHGFQGEVFTSTPAQPKTYSALTSHIHVTWNGDAELLDSEEAILQAEKDGRVTLTELPVVINMPQIMWPGGQLPVKEDKTLTDETPYGGQQVLDIDTKKMTVTFVAHRGWGPDGRTIYYIVTDATPEMPAAMMGVASSPTSAKLIANSAAVDLFQFMNGLKGSGPMGFQAGIAAAAPGDQNYSPMWRIFMIGWKDPSSASVLETIGDINALRSAGKIDVQLARPMDSDHIVNCPFIDPFQ
ncbi:MAG: hypothetical protein ACK4TO_08690 [Candidatus Nitrosotenuis sp.]